MAKPWIHSERSAKRYGGVPEDYLAIHEWFDQTKAIMPDNRHRALRHHSEGIFVCEQVFGSIIVNSQNKEELSDLLKKEKELLDKLEEVRQRMRKTGRVVSVRQIGEDHVLEDFANLFIPTPQDYLQEMEMKLWMNNAAKGATPESFKKIAEKRVTRKIFNLD